MEAKVPIYVGESVEEYKKSYRRLGCDPDKMDYQFGSYVLRWEDADNDAALQRIRDFLGTDAQATSDWLKVLAVIVWYRFAIFAHGRPDPEDEMVTVITTPGVNILEEIARISRERSQIPQCLKLAAAEATGLEGTALEYEIDILISDMSNHLDVAGSYKAWVEWRAREREREAEAALGPIFIFIGALFAIIFAAALSSAIAAYSVAIAKGATVVKGVWTGMIAFVDVVVMEVKLFLEAIHYKTLLAVHRVAYLLSEDYRKMMQKVYVAVSEVSEAIGMGPGFLLNVINNARSLVLSTSQLLGCKYDLAQVHWLKISVDYLKTMDARAWRYKDHPELVFEDLEHLVDRPTLDAGGSTMQTIWNTLENLTNSADKIVQDVAVVKNDLDQLVSDLPKEIREEIKPYVDPVIDRVDGFLEEDYRPFKKRLDEITDILNMQQNATKNRVDGIVDRLTRPGDLLRDVDLLSDDQRITQENKISEVSVRSGQRQADNLAAQAQPTWEHLEKLKRALEERPPPPEYKIEERKKPVVPAGKQSKEADTWFVGDY